MSGGAFLLDVRRTDDAAALFVDGAVNIPLGKSFLTWAGWLAPYDRDIYLVASDEGQARRAAHELALIGIDRVAGFSDPAELVTTGARPDQVPQTSPAGVAEDVFAGRVTVLDVRNDHEWEQGHIPGAVHVPLGKLRERLAEVPRDRPVVTQCQGGTRSAIAASLLRAAGRRDVTNLRGGFGEWERGGHPVARDGNDR